MAPSEGTFRARAASLLNPFASKSHDIDEKQKIAGATINEKGTGEAPGDDHLHPSDVQEEARAHVAQIKVRSIPGR